ncbi:hypothetical protein [Aureibaculum luteum]|uniref:hypothetical protein n=1 Tax=Aureibaculum luteum TaxID=1548456 RepID=UPI000E4B7AFF|nr:hypothetical protein [Aureibaculum luteum]
MVRKELHLDEAIINALETEAKKQQRSLKNYLENLVIKEASKLEVPSKEYTKMMDNLLDKFDNNEIEFSSINDVMIRNGLSN